MWGLYLHSREYRKIFLRNYFWNMYLHLCPLPLYGYSGCIHAPLVPLHKNILGELISLRIHAAHVFAPGWIQEIFLANYLCIGFVPGGIVHRVSLKTPTRVFRGILQTPHLAAKTVSPFIGSRQVLIRNCPRLNCLFYMPPRISLTHKRGL